MRAGLALPQRAKRPHASHAPPTVLRLKAVLLEDLEKAFVRRFSISIPNLSIASTSISFGSEDTMWRPRAWPPTHSQ